ncbi:MAG: peptidylprolyl isomerase [Marinovum algicola]|jgi:peptidyl-prolyl cis-trans isomerase SurA|uniref:Parvulin-like PPIase n=2 Tax=Marinovum TaxID=367771 RepID=A0A975W7M9_9RHOB|nr:peptidylprolyl isomerase [Marinovum algicola]SEI81775.1 periplasmic chaperone for outer membrane proteins SurA [Marinovum algicola]SLN16133.1 Chaperone SurA precursor [Marinovum algicola]
MISRFFRTAAAALLIAPLTPLPVPAQGLFSPAIKVDEMVITNYEINQRMAFLEVLRAPGNPRDLAREQLIEDRLKLREAEALGITVSPEQIAAGMEEFAGRANLTADQLIAELSGLGVSAETFRDFVRAGVAWREVVRARFAGSAQVSEAEIDRALNAAGGGSSVRVLLAEIIMPAPPAEAEAVMARAQRIARTTSEAEFAAAARQYSATATARSGGKLPWQQIEDLPPVLRPLVLELSPGEVTDPLAIPNAVALFQLRALEETEYAPPSYSAVEYAAYYMAGGRSEQTLAQAVGITARIDTCDDLYGVAKGQPEEVLDRSTLPPDQIPDDIAIELAKLDPGETSTALTRAGGETLVLLMLCGRSPAVEEAPDREAVTTGLRNRRVGTLSESFLEQLRADARIVELE